jgi:hypothetical protein
MNFYEICYKHHITRGQSNFILSDFRRVKLLASVDISTHAPWITQNEQHFVASEIPHELDAQMEGH